MRFLLLSLVAMVTAVSVYVAGGSPAAVPLITATVTGFVVFKMLSRDDDNYYHCK